MKDFRKLKVWEKSHVLVLSIYKVTLNFPKDEMYGLTNQMRRASVSIPSNIAEGCGRDSEKEFIRFLQITFGSANELEYQLILSKNLSYINSDVFDKLMNNIQEVKKMLSALIKKIKQDNM
jgi:four helix bundle protein